jgi:hypothetical protein
MLSGCFNQQDIRPYPESINETALYETSKIELFATKHDEYYTAYTRVLMSTHPQWKDCDCERSKEIFWRLLAEVSQLKLQGDLECLI